MEIHDVARGYETKSDDELLRLALNEEELTPEAAAALARELSRRGIDGAERLEVFREEEEWSNTEPYKHKPLFFVWPWGVGFKRFGKADRIDLSKTHRERFRTTIFLVLFWLPLVPTGTHW